MTYGLAMMIISRNKSTRFATCLGIKTRVNCGRVTWLPSPEALAGPLFTDRGSRQSRADVHGRRELIFGARDSPFRTWFLLIFLFWNGIDIMVPRGATKKGIFHGKHCQNSCDMAGTCYNVGLAIINHPPNHHFYGWYKHV